MGSRILVIEDNPINLELMTYLLGAWGHEVATALDGESGIALARSRPFDLIVCDVQMPGMDGYEVARTLKADPALAAVPLLAVTAYAMVGDADRALAAGFDGHFSKPIDPPAFMAALADVLQAPHKAPPPSPDEVSPRLESVPVELGAPRPGITLLLADDSPVNLHFKVAVFEPAGYRVVCVHDGVEALAQIRLRSVDLVISDVAMPGGDGFALLAAIRADAALRDLPFVFLTSTARDADSQARGRALGATDYLLRPIEPAELLRAVRAALCGGAARA